MALLCLRRAFPKSQPAGLASSSVKSLRSHPPVGIWRIGQTRAVQAAAPPKQPPCALPPHGLPPFTAATLGRLLTPAAAPAIIAGREEQRGSGGGLRTPLDSSNNKCVPNVRSTIAGRGELAQVVRRDVERNEQCRVVPQCTASQKRVHTADRPNSCVL